jgi:hypothetical protein
MARVPNPYRPGFNQAPTALAGRDVAIASITEALDVAALDGRTPRPVVFVGGRGVGKTVLLGEAAAIAADKHSWLAVPVEVRPGRDFTPQLIERLAAARDLYRQVEPGKRLQVTAAKVRATVLGVGGEVEITRNPSVKEAPALPLEAALADACAAAAEHAAGLLITVDELQLADRHELADFAATLQQHVPDNWPLVVIVAGLPSIRDAHRGVTYLERGEWQALGLLDDAATRTALAEPARQAGRPMSTAACGALAVASGGYPYAIQLMGHHAWRQSTGDDVIDVPHVPAAIAAADQELRAGLYESRWYDAAPKERTYLQALAQLVAGGRSVDGADVARALGKSTSSVSYLRDRLIRKGTIFADAGTLRFAVPGMADWIRQSQGAGATSPPPT